MSSPGLNPWKVQRPGTSSPSAPDPLGDLRRPLSLWTLFIQPVSPFPLGSRQRHQSPHCQQGSQSCQSLGMGKAVACCTTGHVAEPTLQRRRAHPVGACGESILSHLLPRAKGKNPPHGSQSLPALLGPPGFPGAEGTLETQAVVLKAVTLAPALRAPEAPVGFAVVGPARSLPGELFPSGPACSPAQVWSQLSLPWAGGPGVEGQPLGKEREGGVWGLRAPLFHPNHRHTHPKQCSTFY